MISPLPSGFDPSTWRRNITFHIEVSGDPHGDSREDLHLDISDFLHLDLNVFQAFSLACKNFASLSFVNHAITLLIAFLLGNSECTIGIVTTHGFVNVSWLGRLEHLAYEEFTVKFSNAPIPH